MSKYGSIVFYFLLILIAFPVIFLKLGSFSIRWADEGMYAVNVYEMLHGKNMLVPYFNNVMDVVNLKPPLVLWIQLIFVKIFGYNALALRLPSALADMGVILLVFGFLKKHFSVFIGFAGALVLITAQGLHTFHSGRTCDPDSVTALFIAAANIVFLNTVIDKKLSGLRIILFFLFTILAFWSKSMLAFLFLPSIIALILTDKELRPQFLKSRLVWSGILILLLASASWLIIRNHYQPGFIGRFVSRDMGRVLTNIENYREPFMYYIWQFNDHRFTYWLMPALIAIFGGTVLIFRNGIKMEKLAFTLILMTLSYWLIISLMRTKAPWYDIPLYPLLAVLIAYLAWILIGRLNVPARIQLLALILFFIPYRDIFGMNQSNNYVTFENQNESKERYIHSMILKKQPLDGYVAYHDGYFGCLLFYEYQLRELGQHFRIETEGKFTPGEKVIASQEKLMEKLEKAYSFRIIGRNEYVKVYQILGTAPEGMGPSGDGH